MLVRRSARWSQVISPFTKRLLEIEDEEKCVLKFSLDKLVLLFRRIPPKLVRFYQRFTWMCTSAVGCPTQSIPLAQCNTFRCHCAIEIKYKKPRRNRNQNNKRQRNSICKRESIQLAHFRDINCWMIVRLFRTIWASV